MNTTERARKLIVQERQQDEHLEKNMLSRAVEGEQITEAAAEKARELLAQERRQEENLQENMLSRATEEVERQEGGETGEEFKVLQPEG